MRRTNFVGTKSGGGESEGGAGIHFPHTPFSSRPARAQSEGLPRLRRGIIGDSVQKRFVQGSVIAIAIQSKTPGAGVFDCIAIGALGIEPSPA